MNQPHALFAAAFGAVCVVAIGLAGCDTATDSPAPPTWHADIKPIVQSRCANCHYAGGIGPFDFTTYTSAKTAAKLIKAQTGARAMPPWGAAPLRHYRFNPRLDDGQIALIAAWADAGAPEGDAAAKPTAVPDVSPKLSRSDEKLEMPVAYTPQKEPDDYRCFLLPWKRTDTVYVTGFAALPGNTAVVHHIAAYLFNPEKGADYGKIFTDLDAKEPGPGYTCFGGPTGDSGALVPTIQQLAQWVPGARGTDFPEGTGIEVKPGAFIVLQIHYNTNAAGPQPDKTSIELRVDKAVKNPAAYAPFLNALWPTDPTSMLIKNGNAAAEHSYTADPRGLFKQFVGGLNIDNGFDIHSVLLHMHELGKSALVTVQHKDGSATTLLDIPTYDFNWQRVYWLQEPVRFKDGDQLKVICRWDNTASNQPVYGGKQKVAADVKWGEGTNDEMCVANLYISQL